LAARINRRIHCDLIDSAGRPGHGISLNPLPTGISPDLSLWILPERIDYRVDALAGLMQAGISFKSNRQ
jgi:hypothetical protein